MKTYELLNIFPWLDQRVILCFFFNILKLTFDYKIVYSNQCITLYTAKFVRGNWISMQSPDIYKFIFSFLSIAIFMDILLLSVGTTLFGYAGFEKELIDLKTNAEKVLEDR